MLNYDESTVLLTAAIGEKVTDIPIQAKAMQAQLEQKGISGRAVQTVLAHAAEQREEHAGG